MGILELHHYQNDEGILEIHDYGINEDTLELHDYRIDDSSETMVSVNAAFLPVLRKKTALKQGRQSCL